MEAGAGGLQKADGRPEEIGMPAVVVVMQDDVMGAAVADPEIARRLHTGADLPVEQAAASVQRLGIAGEDPVDHRQIAGVADDDELPVLEPLAEDAAQGPIQGQRPVLGTHDDGNGRIGHGLRYDSTI